MNALRIIRAGPLTTVQDLGRHGHAALGVGVSGAADMDSHIAADLAVGNPPSAATLEVTFGGLEVEAVGGVVVALAGAPCPGSEVGLPMTLAAGDRLRLPRPSSGIRTYLAVRGGIAVTPVLGSRSTDVLAGVGPAVIVDGDVLPVGDAKESTEEARRVAVPAVAEAPTIGIDVRPGPWEERYADAWAALADATYTVTPASNRIGVRLDGPTLPVPSGDIEPVGLLAGAIQVPPDGRPIVMLADHPVTGGYPVVAVVEAHSIGAVAQARPGVAVRFRPATFENVAL